MLCLYADIDTGHLIVFKHPYPRDVDEIHDYSNVTEHFIPKKKGSQEIVNNPDTKTYSVSVREYDVNEGCHIKYKILKLMIGNWQCKHLK